MIISRNVAEQPPANLLKQERLQLAMASFGDIMYVLIICTILHAIASTVKVYLYNTY